MEKRIPNIVPLSVQPEVFENEGQNNNEPKSESWDDFYRCTYK